MAALRVVKRDRPWVEWWAKPPLPMAERAEDEEVMDADSLIMLRL